MMAIDRDDTTTNPPDVLDLDESAQDSRPPRPPSGPDLATLMRVGEKWGYVDDDGAIHVRAGKHSGDRIVAKVPPSKRAETLANLLLRFQELEDRFAALSKQLKRSRNPGRDLKSLQSFVHWAEGAEAIGDYDALLGRAHAAIERIRAKIEDGASAKQTLVERAEALAESSSWKSTGDLMDELMQEWKLAGSAGRDQDEELWQRFNGARKTFFKRRSEHYADLKKNRAAARETKEHLIVQAEALAPSTDYDGTFDAMQALFEEWKRAGSAGRDIDEQLWQRFHAARDPFFERRKKHFAEQRRAQGGDRRDQRRSGPDGPRGGRGGPRGRDDRRGAPGQRGRRDSGGAVLTSTLGDLVGPLKDLFPEDRDKKKKG
jgi:hypothetical protein